MANTIQPVLPGSKLAAIFSPKMVHRIVYSRFAQVVIDGAIVAATFVLAYIIRFDGQIPPMEQERLSSVLPVIVLLYVSSNFIWCVYRQVWRFIGLTDCRKIAYSVACSAAIAFSLNFLYSSAYSVDRVPFGVMLVHPLLVFTLWLGPRIVRRSVYNRKPRPKRAALEGRKRILLVGAGQAGLSLMYELRRRAEFKIVGFLDDNPQIRGRLIEGYPVLGSTHQVCSIVEQYKVDEVTLCMPTAPVSVVARIAAECKKISVKTTTVPTLSEILLGKLTISRLRPVSMEDLLGRHSISYPKDDDELVTTYRDRRILVTGAGGSIGSELTRQLKQFKPSQLILLDKDENNLYEIVLEIKADFSPVSDVVADIRDFDRIERVFECFRPEVVFHAAAYKHVPLMESHPAEAILNNVVGSRNLIDASATWGVKNFVLISTDKAVNPTNIMGASKRVAEMILQQRARRGKTKFCGVRFGNVLGSRASVVPLFQKQIREGKAITVTHPDVRRYFMTIPEAVQLVIQAGSLGYHGEIFVLDMGDPVRIWDLAKNLVELSGLVVGKDVKIEFTGLRPGEKLYEELLISGENGVRNTKYSKIFVAEALSTNGSVLTDAVQELERAARASDLLAIHRALRALQIGYTPSSPPSLVHMAPALAHN